MGLHCRSVNESADAVRVSGRMNRQRREPPVDMSRRTWRQVVHLQRPIADHVGKCMAQIDKGRTAFRQSLL